MSNFCDNGDDGVFNPAFAILGGWSVESSVERFLMVGKGDVPLSFEESHCADALLLLP